MEVLIFFLLFMANFLMVRKVIAHPFTIFKDTLRGQLGNIIALNPFFNFLPSPLLSLPFLFCLRNKYWYLHGEGIFNDTRSIYSEHNLFLRPHNYNTNLFLMHRNMLFLCSVSCFLCINLIVFISLILNHRPFIIISIWFHIFILSLPCIKLQC